MLATIRLPSDPHLRRWMLFMDGENMAIRAKALAAARGVSLTPGEHYSPDTFVWMPGVRPTDALVNSDETPIKVQPHAIRSYCYTSVWGADELVNETKEKLWKLGFSPHVFKKSRRDTKAKGVDIAMTRDLLSHAHLDNYDVAVIVSGDGDYVPVLEEVKRLGKVVYVVAFASNGLSPELRLCSDMFFDMESFFVSKWSQPAASSED